MKRWTLCFVAGHTWAKIGYPGSEGTGHFVRCLRCRHESHAGTSVRPTGIG